MSTLTPKNLYIGNGTGSNVYTAGSNIGDYTIIKNINICNYDTSTARTVSVNIIPSGNSSGSNNLLLSNLVIPPNDVVQIDTSIVLDQSGAIAVTHSGNITTIISGVEYK
jgi:hypothetical protein